METKRAENINNNTNLRSDSTYLEILHRLLKNTTLPFSLQHARTYLRNNKNNRKSYHGLRNMEIA